MSLCTDIYNKTLSQENDLNKLCNELLLDKNLQTLNKIKTKIDEKILNYENTISLLEKQVISEFSSYSSNRTIWNKKIENLKSKLSNFPIQVKTNYDKANSKQKNLLKENFVSDTNQNLKYLTNEHDSLVKCVKLGRDIESHETLLLNELDNQGRSLSSLKGKINTLYSKVDFTNTITQWLVRRGATDKQLFFGLVLVTFSIIYITIYYVKPWLRGL